MFANQPAPAAATPYYASPSYGANAGYYNTQAMGYGNTGDMGLMY
jgi:hypothetical protein